MMQLETELSIHDRDAEIRVLRDWLHQACALLSVEMREHEENRQWEDRKQRQEIAKTLRRFLVQATNVLDSATTV